MNDKNFIQLKDLKEYLLSRILSAIAWDIYSNMSFEDKNIRDQFLRATYPIEANITEGYIRYHF